MERLFGGRYRVEAALGAGAQGAAFLVRDMEDGAQAAALKVGRSGQERADGTLAEFEALCALHSPWIAPVLELGFASPRDLALLDLPSDPHGGARPYLVRAWIEGPHLLDWSQRAEATTEQRLALLAALAEAVDALHRAGLVHGDLKPEHVLVQGAPARPAPRLIDLGLSAQHGRGGRGGTPGYLAPERLRGQPADAAADRFALGVVMAQALLGRRAALQSADPLAALDLPQRARLAIARLLDPDPARRPPLQEVSQALRSPADEASGQRDPRPLQLPFLGVARRAWLDALAHTSPPAPVVLLHAPRGQGRSRALRHLGWELQRAGRPALTLASSQRPADRLLALGRRLAALASRPYAPPAPSPQGDRARWLGALADALEAALPPHPVELLWDDPGADLAEGLDAAEVLALLLERAPGRLRLWATATPALAPALRALFASPGFTQLDLPPLTRDDLDGLLGLEHLGLTLSHGDLERAWEASLGAPAALARHFSPHAPLLDGDPARTLGVLEKGAPDDPQTIVFKEFSSKDEARIVAAWAAHEGALRGPAHSAARLALLELGLEAARAPALLEDLIDAASRGGAQGRARAWVAGQLALASGEWAARLRLAAARLAWAAGDGAGAALEGWEAPDARCEAQAANLRTQAALRRARYAQAQQEAEAACARLEAAGVQGAEVELGELRATAAVAAAMQGEAGEGALAATREALEAADAPAAVLARLSSLWGMVAMVRGDLEGAVERYQEALELVERRGLDAERPLALLNLGAAHEREGRLSLALTRYTQGARAALPTTRASTRALLLANRANLEIKLGRPREARELLAAARRVAQEASLPYVLNFISHLEADVLDGEGDLEGAAAAYEALAPIYEAQEDRRHGCELRLKAGLGRARLGQSASARALLAQAEVHIDEFEDLKPRAGFLRAELDFARGPEGALVAQDRFLKALGQAREGGDELTALTAAASLARRLRATPGADALFLRELGAQIDQSWRRVALTLTPDLRAELAASLHLEATPAAAPQAMSRPPLPASMGSLAPPMRPTLRPHEPGELAEFGSAWELGEQLFKILSLSRGIIGEPDLEALIARALDIALELSRARRGFVLLRARDDAPFEVAFSRDEDRRPIPASALAISETIARQVAASGEPVLTVDASQDARFGEARSVVDFQLNAVLCVPLRDRERALGCLYLDRRGPVEGGFTPHTLRMIGAFADQVAVALLSARQVEALRHERDALREARAQIEALLREREARLEDLATRCQRLEGDLARERLRYDYDQIVAQAPAMRRVLAQLDRVLDSALPLVIQGESGTGKELIARAAHQQSARRARPFVAINCGALSEALLESELFGHKKGAFTGAVADHKGLFEAAHGGTLFLDEVGEMSLAMQVKLLRALQERAVRPVGAAQELPVEVRVVAATNRDLRRMVAEGAFREDLYYRLATVTLALPPLRERREDIPLLAHRLLERAAQREGRAQAPGVSGEAVALLCEAPWPGNIRQLENVLHTAMLLCEGEITAEGLTALLPPAEAPRRVSPQRAVARAGEPKARRRRGRPSRCTAAEARAALEACDQDREAAARRLGISTRTLQRYLSADS